MLHYRILKRIFDIAIAIFFTVAFLPISVIIAILIKLESAGPIFFRQARTGRLERPFYILKFRTMHHESQGLNITMCGDDRITRLGRILRKTKLDELPQLMNVLKGEMSIVGPRPEVVSHLTHYDPETRHIIFSERPGITDLASLLYIHEERLLAESDDPVKTYFDVILPEKNRLRVRHIVQESMLFDLKILIWTVLKIVFRHQMPLIKCPDVPPKKVKPYSVHEHPPIHSDVD
jgi:lipopolysaccharide/colanic/teichoic acid biosynthesis glycosyltransferase